MPQLIFINLPVADLPRSIAFYEAVGAARNPMFSDETAACMVVSDVIHVMLLTHDKWRTFTDRQIPDAHASAQVLLCLSQDSRAAVDAVVAQAGTAGGRVDPNPTQDYGFMYGRSYADPDGHIWEVMWMDAAAVAAGPETFAADAGVS
nr:VOC family protein [uncultured Brevundimonas sp.]